MKLSSHILMAGSLFLLLASAMAVAQGDSYSRSADAESTASASTRAAGSRAGMLSVAFVAPELIGTYGPDGRYRKANKSRFRGDMSSTEQANAVDLPTWIHLHTMETVVENYAPPAHAVRTLRAPSKLGTVRDNFFTAIFGREQVLFAPTHVVTDSKGRVIISDPKESAIHVLDDKESFRILAGGDYRLQRPTGLAVDGEDNIYVADEKLGIVQVYDSQGTYIRSIGYFKGENMFDRPMGIAIDRSARKLYVLDSKVGEIFVLDLQGKVLRRVGGRRDSSGLAKLDAPTEIAAKNGTIVVLDSANTRVQVFDADFNLVSRFNVRIPNRPPDGTELGVALDNQGRIFISNLNSSHISIYDVHGQRVGSIEQFGNFNQTFRAPAGVWIDSADRLFVADTQNRRIAVFMLAAPQISHQ